MLSRRLVVVRGKIGVGEVMRPFGCMERAVFAAPAELQQNGVTHRAIVAALLLEFFAELCRLFPPRAELRSREAQDAVAGAICKEFPRYSVTAVLIAIPRLNRGDSGAVAADPVDRGVQKQRDVLLAHNCGVPDIIPERVTHERIAVNVLKLKLFKDAGLLVVVAVRSHDSHADLA